MVIDNGICWKGRFFIWMNARSTPNSIWQNWESFTDTIDFCEWFTLLASCLPSTNEVGRVEQMSQNYFIGWLEFRCSSSLEAWESGLPLIFWTYIARERPRIWWHWPISSIHSFPWLKYSEEEILTEILNVSARTNIQLFPYSLCLMCIKI